MKITFIHCTNTPSGSQVIVRELHELARVEMRCAGGPRMRGLRHDGVVAAVGEPQRAARVVEDDVDARIGERIALAQRARLRDSPR